MKIYIPQTIEVRNRVTAEIGGTKEADYVCNANEYKLLREISEEEFEQWYDEHCANCIYMNEICMFGE